MHRISFYFLVLTVVGRPVSQESSDLQAPLLGGLGHQHALGRQTESPSSCEGFRSGIFGKAIAALHDATADKPQKMFNRQTTGRGSFIAITGHFGAPVG